LASPFGDGVLPDTGPMPEDALPEDALPEDALPEDAPPAPAPPPWANDVSGAQASATISTAAFLTELIERSSAR